MDSLIIIVFLGIIVACIYVYQAKINRLRESIKAAQKYRDQELIKNMNATICYLRHSAFTAYNIKDRRFQTVIDILLSDGNRENPDIIEAVGELIELSDLIRGMHILTFNLNLYCDNLNDQYKDVYSSTVTRDPREIHDYLREDIALDVPGDTP